MTDEEIKSPAVIPEKLYAGKFKSVEELENGYKHSSVVYSENEKLKSDLKEFTDLPANYTQPADVALSENRIADIKSRAKEAGMTQAQYEKFVRDDKARVDQFTSRFEDAKKAVGESTINILKDYVTKNYPKALQEGVMATLIQNKEARDEALGHREALLNSSVPGLNNPAQSRTEVTDEDVSKAYLAKESKPHDVKLRQAYLNVLDARAKMKA